MSLLATFIVSWSVWTLSVHMVVTLCPDAFQMLHAMSSGSTVAALPSASDTCKYSSENVFGSSVSLAAFAASVLTVAVNVESSAAVQPFAAATLHCLSVSSVHGVSSVLSPPQDAAQAVQADAPLDPAK